MLRGEHFDTADAASTALFFNLLFVPALRHTVFPRRIGIPIAKVVSISVLVHRVPVSLLPFLCAISGNHHSPRVLFGVGFVVGFVTGVHAWLAPRLEA